MLLPYFRRPVRCAGRLQIATIGHTAARVPKTLYKRVKNSH